MKLQQKIRVRGGLWDEILPETSESMRANGYVIISRPPSYSQLQRYGRHTGAISVKAEELPERVQGIVQSILATY